MKLTKRLQTIADLVGDVSKIYDVGCDHAYLDIYLASKGIKCVAIDVRNQIVKFAQKNVDESGYQDKIDVVLNNGLNGFKVDKEELVIMSGLGTRTILDIIKNQPVNRLIIQSNDNLFLLRKNMMNQNYYISDEKIVFEDNKYYVIIKFESGFKEYTDYELLLGPKLLHQNTDVFTQYLRSMLSHYRDVLLAVPANYLERRIAIEQIIKYIEMALR
ncbi:MAG: SAM-dependent methyltransferase [Firmicutes bacterium]|nr:SAM-dependent methyltransferase [Bacillota bacterium]